MKISELPDEIKKTALLRQKECTDNVYSKITDDISGAFAWFETKEGAYYWDGWHNRKPFVIQLNDEFKEPKHYDNSKGSLYQFCEQQGINSYEFEIIKRIVRCRKKGEWITDIEKTINVLELYKKEQGHLYKNQIEKINGDI